MGSPRIFIDTNVLVYTLDAAEAAKRATAMSLVDERRDDIVLSTQVLIETYAVCVRKLGLTATAANEIIASLAAFPIVDTDRGLVVAAVDLAASEQLSIFDALIVRAAQRAGCTTLMTEDLQDGRRYGSLTVRNPFGS